MKRALLLALLITTARAADIPPPVHPDERASITEEQLEELPADTTFDDLRARLGGYMVTALAAPHVTFRLQENNNDEFIVFWDIATGKVLLVAKYPVGQPRSSNAIYVWPGALKGMKMDAPLLTLPAPGERR